MKIVIDWFNDDGELVDVTNIADVDPPAAFQGSTFGTQFRLRIDEDLAVTERDSALWPHQTAEEAADCVMCSPSALAGTSAQARHTADDVQGGGERG